MSDKELHEKLIEELLTSPQTAREHAAVNEINALREKLEQLEKPKQEKKADK
jgi:hypothetical protein